MAPDSNPHSLCRCCPFGLDGTLLQRAGGCRTGPFAASRVSTQQMPGARLPVTRIDQSYTPTLLHVTGAGRAGEGVSPN